MVFQKVLLKKPYFKRLQTKFRRRREGKTDYHQRKILILQAKNKYNTPKYRLIVRFTNQKVICQIAYPKICGDVMMASATSTELKHYGIEVGLTNYAAAYCTGLLVARRLLNKVNLDTKYLGQTNIDGTVQVTEENEEGPRPFKAYLDVGLARTSTGAKVFAAAKGASDGGLLVPHNERRFPGYDPESKTLDAEVLKNHLLGKPIADYMIKLKEEEEEKYQKHFSRFIKAGIKPENLADMYLNAHKKIRENPNLGLDQKSEKDKKKEKSKKSKLTNEQRKKNVIEKKKKFAEENNMDVDQI